MFMCDTKNGMRTAAVILVLTLVMVGQATAGVTLQEWRFNTDANPAPPEVCDQALSTARATMAPGDFATGWQEELPGLGSATGFWDLGRRGTIRLPVASGTLVGAADGGTRIWVKVCQWIDGGIFAQVAAVSVGGATRASEVCNNQQTCPVGGWVVHESVWLLPAGQHASEVTVTSPGNGSLVDLVSVSTEPASSVPVVLAIRLSDVEGSVDLSWPASATGYALEGTPSLSEPRVWEPVTITPQVVGARNVVTTESAGAAKFYRLRKP